MLFTLRSIARSSASIAASVSLRVFGPVTAAPAGACRADPVVTPWREFEADPDDCAVPALLVPGDPGEASLEELPAPLGSLTALLRPPAFAGPEGTPLTPAVPAPAEPALGLPTALRLPAAAPLAAPPALAPPPPAPLEPPPPPPPPPPCARAAVEPAASHMIATHILKDNLVIQNLPSPFNRYGRAPFRNELGSRTIDAERSTSSVRACARAR